MLAAGPELRITGAAAQTRMVSVARIRLVSRKSTRLFKGIICDDISEFESHMPSHAVRSLWLIYGPAFDFRRLGLAATATSPAAPRRRGAAGDEGHLVCGQSAFRAIAAVTQ